MSKSVKAVMLFIAFMLFIALIASLMALEIRDWPVETDDASAIRAVINTGRHQQIVDIEIADLDGDGTPEIVVAQYNSVLVYANPLM